MEQERRSSGEGVVRYNQEGLPALICTEELSAGIHFCTVAHWHEELEFLRVVSGEMQEEVNGRAVRLREGDILFVNSGQLHCSRPSARGGSDCRFSLISFHPSVLLDNTLLARDYILPLTEDQRFDHLLIPAEHADSGRWAQVFAVGEEIAAAGGSRRVLGLTGIFYVMFSLLREEYEREYRPKKRAGEGEGLSDVRRMVAFICSNYEKKITLDEVAAVVPTSRSRCTRLFQRYVEQSPTDFLNDYRLQMAEQLLRETDRPIGSIATDCGFSDQSYMSKVFRRRYGTSPQSYRKTHREQVS